MASSGQHRLPSGSSPATTSRALGARVALGRALMADDARTPGGEPVAVLTDRPGRASSIAIRRPSAASSRSTARSSSSSASWRRSSSAWTTSPRDIWVPMTMYGAVFGDDLFGANQPRPVRSDRAAATRRHAAAGAGSLALEPFETRVGRPRRRGARATCSCGPRPTRMTLERARVPVARVRGVRAGARRRVRQRVERHARAGERPPPRDRHSAVDRRQPRPRRAATGDRRAADRRAGRAGRPRARRRARFGSVSVLFVAMLPPTIALARPLRAARLRLSRVPLCVRGGRRRHDPVCVGAGAAGHAIDADRRACAVSRAAPSAAPRCATGSSRARSRSRWCS